MPHTELDKFLRLEGQKLPAPVAIILAEDEIELDSAVEHQIKAGFGTVIVVGDVASATVGGAHYFPAQLNRIEDSVEVINKVVRACTGKWIYYGFNAEYLFFPYCETRDIKDAITFMEEERRSAVFSYAIDLYPENLSEHGNGVDIGSAQLDRSGYYGQERFIDGEAQERQIEVFGGLRWRFEEHIPWEKRRIDRISLFKANAGVEIDLDLRLNDPELNTIACQWHNNMTLAVMSFRVAKALMHNPGSADDIDTFHWGGSRKFEWTSTQLLELGFMEPGQWF